MSPRAEPLDMNQPLVDMEAIYIAAGPISQPKDVVPTAPTVVPNGLGDPDLHARAAPVPSTANDQQDTPSSLDEGNGNPDTFVETIDLRSLTGTLSDDSEDSIDLERDIDRSNRDYTARNVKSLPPLGLRHAKGNKRVLQHQSYIRLVETRLASLEIEIEQLREQTSRNRADDADDVSRAGSLSRRSSIADVEGGRERERERKIPDDPYAVLPCIARMPLSSFRPGQPTEFDDRASLDSNIHLHADTPHNPFSVLEVALDPPSRLGSRRRPRSRHASISSTELSDETTESQIEPELLARVPDRVRIRSKALLKALEKITEGKFTIPKVETPSYRPRRVRPGHANIELPQPPGKDGQPPVVFLRPFKIFVEFEEKIREYARGLEKKHDEKLNTDETDSDRQAERLVPVITISGEEDSNHADELLIGSKEALDHFRLLVEFLDYDLKGLFELRRQIKNGTLRSIAFVDLWHLFVHGEEVCRPSEPRQLYRVLHFTGGRKYLSDKDKDEIIIRRGTRRERNRPPPPRYRTDNYARRRVDNYDDDSDADVEYLTPARKGSDFSVQCFSFDFDGLEYGPTQNVVKIPWFDGDSPITSLAVFPDKFRQLGSPTQSNSLGPSKADLIERGRRFVKLSRVAHMQYKGRCLSTGDEVDSQVVVDFGTALQQMRDYWIIQLGVRKPLEADDRETKEESTWSDPKFPRRDPCNLPGCCDNDYISMDDDLDSGHAKDLISEQEYIFVRTSNPDELTEDDLMIFPIRVLGFVLRDRTWAHMDIDKVTDVQPLDAGLDALSLPKGHKDTLLAMVRNHSRGSASVDHIPDDQTQFDLIPGKGKGLIVLLHGQPGVGKTSTAESIAAHTNRPLFPITCGDIGETAEDVDTKLKSTFQLAHKWGCVLLLDEADVFLQRRNKTDLQRNSIVSVFLRVLEYYSGILFLTTNRIGTIDPAFKSRIHMSLYYPALDKVATKEIWTWHIKNVVKNKKDMAVDKKEIFQFALSHYQTLEADKAVWNGRQIRNAFQTAVALAEYDAFKIKEKYKVDEQPHLTAAHFEQVAKASKDFDTYLQSTWGGYTENDLSRRAQERADHARDSGTPREGASRGGRGGAVGGARRPASKPTDDDEFPDDDDRWDEPEEKSSRKADDSDDWNEDNPIPVRGKSTEASLRPDVGTKRAGRIERK